MAKNRGRQNRRSSIATATRKIHTPAIEEFLASLGLGEKQYITQGRNDAKKHGWPLTSCPFEVEPPR